VPKSVRRPRRLAKLMEAKLASVPEELITDKIGRRVISGKQGTLVYWRMKAAHAAGHQHPGAFARVIKGAVRLRIGSEGRTMKSEDVAMV
jgi:hypothetical protein